MVSLLDSLECRHRPRRHSEWRPTGRVVGRAVGAGPCCYPLTGSTREFSFSRCASDPAYTTIEGCPVLPSPTRMQHHTSPPYRYISTATLPSQDCVTAWIPLSFDPSRVVSPRDPRRRPKNEAMLLLLVRVLVGMVGIERAMLERPLEKRQDRVVNQMIFPELLKVRIVSVHDA